MPKPSSHLDWTDGAPSKVLEPPTGKKIEGFIKNEKPAFRYINWLFYQIDQWIKYFEERIDSNIASIRTVNTDYSATIYDEVILVDATSGLTTITLPPAASRIGKILRIKKIDTTENYVLIDGYNNELIDGQLVDYVFFHNASLSIISDGISWHIYSRNFVPFHPEISALSPNFSEKSGGMNITLTGNNLYKGMLLRVHNTIVPYTWVSNTEINFISPSHYEYEPVDVKLSTIAYESNVKKIQYNMIPTRTIDGGGYLSLIPVNYGDVRREIWGEFKGIEYQNKLYVAWSEKNNVNYQLRLKYYNDNDTSPEWILTEEQTSQFGLNRNVNTYAIFSDIIIFDNKLIITWYESSKIRVGRYDPNDPDKWKLIDGNTDTGLNYSSNSASNSHLFIYSNELFCVWKEGTKIRCKKYIPPDTWVQFEPAGGNGLGIGTYPADYPNAIVHNNDIFFAFISTEDSNKYYLRVRRYDNGNWTIDDGGDNVGIFGELKSPSTTLFTTRDNDIYVLVSDLYQAHIKVYMARRIGNNQWQPLTPFGESYFPKLGRCFSITKGNLYTYYSIVPNEEQPTYLYSSFNELDRTEIARILDIQAATAGSKISAVVHNNQLYAIIYHYDVLYEYAQLRCKKSVE